jgi:probable HAF family extracellular repeat protein
MAWGINSAGTVVGEAEYASGHPQHAFIYTGGTMIDLNTLIPGSSGWELVSARGINDSGEIVGWGYDNGNERAFLLIPVPEPKYYGVVCSELLLGLVFVRKVSARWRKRNAAERTMACRI